MLTAEARSSAGSCSSILTTAEGWSLRDAVLSAASAKPSSWWGWERLLSSQEMWPSEQGGDALPLLWAPLPGADSNLDNVAKPTSSEPRSTELQDHLWTARNKGGELS